MSHLLVIFNVGAEDPVCRDFLPWWQKSGYDLLFSSPLDAPSRLAGVEHVHFGKALTHRSHDDYWQYQSRVLDTMKYCLTLRPEVFLFTQFDSICLGPLPRFDENACVMHLQGYDAPPFKSKKFWHPPWLFGRVILQRFVEHASRHDIRCEQGVMDRWLAWIMECHGIEPTPCSWSWSANSMDTAQRTESARQAVRDGKLFFHGIKNKSMLERLLA